MKECKKLSSKGHPEAARHLAKQVVSTRKAVTRLYTSKAQLNSIEDNLQIQISMLKKHLTDLILNSLIEPKLSQALIW